MLRLVVLCCVVIIICRCCLLLYVVCCVFDGVCFFCRWQYLLFVCGCVLFVVDVCSGLLLFVVWLLSLCVVECSLLDDGDCLMVGVCCGLVVMCT